MPIAGEPFAFEMRDIKTAPDAPGVYAFFVGRKLVYFGIAEESLRAELVEQFVSQSAMASDETVSGFVVEVLTHKYEAEDRFRELLFEFNSMNGHMPERNSRRPNGNARGPRSGETRREPDALAAGAKRPRWGDHP
ncbi:MAG: hypothetical protein WEB13_02010 [Dehalococcoidia bacterium]